MKAPKHAGVKH